MARWQRLRRIDSNSDANANANADANAYANANTNAYAYANADSGTYRSAGTGPHIGTSRNFYADRKRRWKYRW